jgi:hypothetical protein
MTWPDFPEKEGVGVLRMRAVGYTHLQDEKCAEIPSRH